MSLAALVREVEEDLAFVLKESGAEIKVSDFVLHADAEQLRTLLQNLIQNAVAYSAPRPPTENQVTAEPYPMAWPSTWRTTARAYPPQNGSNVTEPLVRLHRADDPPGFGLGLAMCVRIARAHGGRLEIGPAAGGGTTVSIILPAQVPGAAPTPATPGAG